MFKLLKVAGLVFVTCCLFLSVNLFVSSLRLSHAAGRSVDNQVHSEAITRGDTTSAATIRNGSATEKAHVRDTQSDNKEVQTSLQGNPKINLVGNDTNKTDGGESNRGDLSTYGYVRSAMPTIRTEHTNETLASEANNSAVHDDTHKSKNSSALEISVPIKWCPDIPPHLEGPLAAMHKQPTPQELLAWYPSLELGGRLRPQICTPRERLAIIIPYRNRYSHLHIMLNNILPILQRQQADVTFFVIEQANSETFNRGALLNVGFLEAEKIGNFDCFIFHDVDLIPLNDHNLYRCSSNPRHFAVAMNKYRYKLLYKGYFGGVVGFTKKQYVTVNGCSNVYYGWGGEDDDLIVRIHNKNYTVARYNLKTARYDMIKHRRDRGNEVNPMRKALLRKATIRQDTEGLNSIKYRVNSIIQERIYTWINVSLNMTQVLQAAPDSTLRAMKAEMERTTTPPKPKKRRKKMLTCHLPSKWNAQVMLTLSMVTPDK